MTDITFFKTGHEYDSYKDFWRLVRLAGFPVIPISELDVSRPGVFIGTPHNGEWAHIDNQAGRERNAHIILWNIERPAGSAGAVGKYGMSNRDLIYSRQVDEVWVSDRRLAAETGLRHVVLGSHPGMGEPGKDKRYGFCHMSYQVPRRQTIYKHFASHEVGRNCWPPERDEVLRASKFALNVHQDDHPFQEPLRFALFAAYGLPILSETIFDAYPFGDDTMRFERYEYMASTMRRMMEEDYGKWREMGDRARRLMCGDYEFGKMVRRAVEQRVGGWR